jgi:hypothetical protein
MRVNGVEKAPSSSKSVEALRSPGKIRSENAAPCSVSCLSSLLQKCQTDCEQSTAFIPLNIAPRKVILEQHLEWKAERLSIAAHE